MTQQIWLVLCIKGQEEVIHPFSTLEKANEFAKSDDEHSHVIYSRVLDHPELYDMVVQ